MHLTRTKRRQLSKQNNNKRAVFGFKGGTSATLLFCKWESRSSGGGWRKVSCLSVWTPQLCELTFQTSSPGWTWTFGKDTWPLTFGQRAAAGRTARRPLRLHCRPLPVLRPLGWILFTAARLQEGRTPPPAPDSTDATKLQICSSPVATAVLTAKYQLNNKKQKQILTIT